MSEDPFIAHRSLLFTVAYEMLGSAADAEDVVQETWLRWAALVEGVCTPPEVCIFKRRSPSAITSSRFRRAN